MFEWPCEDFKGFCASKSAKIFVAEQRAKKIQRHPRIGEWIKLRPNQKTKISHGQPISAEVGLDPSHIIIFGLSINSPRPNRSVHEINRHPLSDASRIPRVKCNPQGLETLIACISSLTNLTLPMLSLSRFSAIFICCVKSRADIKLLT